MSAGRLLYFNGKGRAEGIRYVLAQAGATYKDDQFEFANWQEIQEQMPNKRVPVWFEDDRALDQSMAIGEYLARKYGLVSTDEFTAAVQRSFAHNIEDQVMAKYPWYTATFSNGTKEEQDKALNEYFDTKWKAWCEMCEKQLKKNGNGWLAGDKLSWCDLFTAEWADRESRLKAGTLDNYPLLKEHMKRVHELPNIQKYVADRKETLW